MTAGKPRSAETNAKTRRKCNFKPLERVYMEMIFSMQTYVVTTVPIFVYTHTHQEITLKKQLYRDWYLK